MRMTTLKAASTMENVMEGVRRKGNNLGSSVPFLFVLSVVLCAILYAPRVFVRVPYIRNTTGDMVAVDRPSSSPAGGGGGDGNNDDNNNMNIVLELDNEVGSPCSSMREDSICCDRSDLNTDVCFMSGDVRTDAASLSLLLFPSSSSAAARQQKEERIRPYTRKFDRFLMQRIHEVRLRRPWPNEKRKSRCDVRHDAPLLVMTAGGYTGNFFHAFRDGFVPAWLTSQHLRRRVVLGVLAYNPWWASSSMYGRIISGLSRYDVVDLVRDTRTHCFPGAIVGSRFHGILAVEPARLRDNKTVVDFNDFLARAFGGSTSTTGSGDRDHHHITGRNNNNKKILGIVSRKGTRVIENQAAVVELARSVGFEVRVLETASGAPPLPAVFAAVRACDALVGVHGADMTKFLFLRPGHASLTQIVPLGVSSIARDCFGKPSARMGLSYEQYEVRPHESSLSRSYAADDDVLADPEKAKGSRGWAFVSQVYLKGQNVTLDLARFRQTLARMHAHATLSSSSRHQP